MENRYGYGNLCSVLNTCIQYRRVLLCLFLFSINGFVFSQKANSNFRNYLEIDTIKNEEEKIEKYLELSKSFIYIAPDSALFFSNKALLIAEKVEASNFLAKSHELLAKAYLFKSEYNLALKHYEVAHSLCAEMKDMKGVAIIVNQIGIVNKEQGNYVKALENYLSALNYFEELNYVKGQSDCYNNIGLIYKVQGKYSDALLNYEKALELKIEIIDSIGIAKVYNNLGVIYRRTGKFDESLDFTEKSLAIYKAKMNKPGLSGCFNNLGIVYKKFGNYQKALECYSRTLELDRETGYKTGVAIAYGNIANVYLKQGKLDKALVSAQQSLFVAQEVESLALESDALYALSDINGKTGNYKNAYEIYKQFYQMEDSINCNEAKLRLIEMETEYETLNIEKENIVLKKDNEIQSLIIKKQKILRNSAVLLIGLLIIFLLILFRLYRKKNYAYGILNEKNKIIKEQRNDLQEAVATKDKFFSIIAHDLLNPFNSIAGFSNLLKVNYDSLSDQKRRRYIDLLADSTDTTISLIKNLLDWARIQMNRIKIVIEKLNLSECIDASIEVYSALADQKSISVEINVPSDIFFYGDKDAFRTVIANLVSNAIKFTHKGGGISIVGSVDKFFITLRIIDNGLGMSEDHISRVFQIDKSISTQGTNNEKGTGLGLILCKEFIESMNGNFEIVSKLGEGTTMIVTLPNAT